MKMNQPSTSGTTCLPSNTNANPKGEMKAITTRSGQVISGPTVPTTTSLPKKVVEHETEATKDTEPPTSNERTQYIQPPVVQSAPKFKK